VSLHAVTFEAVAPVLAPQPVHMDVACFIGLVAERPGGVLPDALDRWLTDRGYGSEGNGASVAPAAEGRLFNRPVPVESVAAFEALFDPDTRLDRIARVAGAALPERLPADADPVIHVVLDGVIHAIALGAPPADPDALLAAIEAAGGPVSATLEATGDGRRCLVLGRLEALGQGTFAVLPNPAYGFPLAQHTRAGSLGSPLAQAVRQFFALGGQRAYVVRMGDPLPYLAPRDHRWQALHRLLVRNAADGAALEASAASAVQGALMGDLVQSDAPASAWYGPEHLFGLDDVGLVLLPDLPDLVAPPPDPAEPPRPEQAPPETFAPCLSQVLPVPDRLAERLVPPVLDATGSDVWQAGLERVLRVIRGARRDVMLIAAAPRGLPYAALGQVLPRSAFLQMADPWVRTPLSAPLPGGLMAPDAILAGRIAANALARGTFRSIAGVPLPHLIGLEPSARQGLPLTRLVRGPRDIRFDSDLTTSADPAWADGPVSRLMALLIRHALRLGADMPFEPSGPALWRRVRGSFERLLERVRRAGGLAGLTAADGYRVRCGPETMTPQDIDAGRVIAEVQVAPVPPIQGITVILPLHTRPAGGPQ